jgi:Predicted membrane protein
MDILQLFEENFRFFASFVALLIEGSVVMIATIGTVQALIRVPGIFSAPEPLVAAKALWLSFAVWILLALEFALAADIIRSAVSPTWDEIGKLAAIAGIRTVLNWFLTQGS